MFMRCGEKYFTQSNKNIFGNTLWKVSSRKSKGKQMPVRCYGKRYAFHGNNLKCRR